jgi:OmpA-OmpF porin, OOP family
MFDCSSRKILIGVVTGTLLSTAVITVQAAGDRETYHLLDSQGQPVKTNRPEECVETPRTPNTPAQLLKECGDITDRDGDGIFDDEDVCPDNTPEELVKGVHQSGPKKGCSLDSDNDGVPDYRSDCPNNTPLEISNGVNDRGCPLDTDQDGVPDYKDQCPGTPFGIAVDENGCALSGPVVTRTLQGDVTFAFDKSVLTEEAKIQLENLINEFGINFIKGIEVVGHTDSVGRESYNQKLSEERSASVTSYLIVLGIQASKINSWGEGELNPVASNDTREGRAQNRRVDIKIEPFQKTQ